MAQPFAGGRCDARGAPRSFSTRLNHEIHDQGVGRIEADAKRFRWGFTIANAGAHYGVPFGAVDSPQIMAQFMDKNLKALRFRARHVLPDQDL